ncbi:MAG: hypothetical protein E7504_07360 [Ruminococcus sp.]|nr:hypothetical protein [Ruminococcus sp.]
MINRFMLRMQSGESYVFETECLAVTLEREAYTPYTQVTATFLSQGQEYGNVTSIQLYHRNYRIFMGLVDSIRQYCRDGRAFVQVKSRSFTSVLAQNEIVPGMHFDMTIGRLMTGFYTFPNVYYEDYAGSGYIFVKDGASIWDSIVNFGYKLSGHYPYIHMNTVRLTPHDSPKLTAPDSSQVLEYGEVQDMTKIVSMYHMADIEDHYDAYRLENPVAAASEIVRHKQIRMDKQYLSEPEQALQFRNLFSQRGWRARYVVYNGFANEEICDRVSFGEFLPESSICRVQMTFGSNGLRTKLWAYDDGFYHIGRAQ